MEKTVKKEIDETKHKVDHLLLLIGKNPLPNAVAGKLLVKDSGSITMLYTAETEAAKINLGNFLSGVTFKEPVKIDKSDAGSIFDGIFKALTLKAGEKQPQSIGLHYTGGTKAMSTHAYRAIERWHNEHAPNCQLVFSYLDARSLRMVFDPPNPLSGSVEKPYVGDQVKISLKELIGLHGWSFNKKLGKSILPVTQALLPELAASLAKVHADPNLIEAWKKWKSANLQSGWNWALPTDTRLANVCQAMKKDLYCNSRVIEGEEGAKDFGLKGQQLRLWLNGGFWLEHHTLQCLTELSADLELHDYGQAIDIAVPGATHFDLDVVALHGYQLFAFSCGIGSNLDDKKDLKLKLFEVFVRARQLGGDEARVALISNYPDPDGLQSEIRSEFDPDGHIRVFGQAQLGSLKCKLASWIKEKSHIS
ncbi:MAG TPA: hypothetical protein PKC13_25775 [Blastocatellia bacterium]|nr:hypothetical protein [Blastocatellia bacterium]HMX29021.1 hypothetical protein [Blastocatellia bacterium]HNG28330.1 hypothetical protein [Blastocatellia bacterium]